MISEKKFEYGQRQDKLLLEQLNSRLTITSQAKCTEDDTERFSGLPSGKIAGTSGFAHDPRQRKPRRGCLSCTMHKKLHKRIQRMPWRTLPTKDVDGCDKPRGAANQALNRGCPNGETLHGSCHVALSWIHRLFCGNRGNWNILVPRGKESKQRYS